MTDVYVVHITDEDNDLHMVVGIFSSKEKALIALANFCREADFLEAVNDDDVIAEYFDNHSYDYHIETVELDPHDKLVAPPKKKKVTITVPAEFDKFEGIDKIKEAAKAFAAKKSVA
jgi:hypothetical protein